MIPLRTTIVPKGRGPFPNFNAGCLDALHLDGLDQVAKQPGGWTLPRFCYESEEWNGWGYRSHGIPSPYVFGATNEARGQHLPRGLAIVTGVMAGVGFGLKISLQHRDLMLRAPVWIEHEHLDRMVRVMCQVDVVVIEQHLVRQRAFMQPTRQSDQAALGAAEGLDFTGEDDDGQGAQAINPYGRHSPGEPAVTQTQPT